LFFVFAAALDWLAFIVGQDGGSSLPLVQGGKLAQGPVLSARGTVVRAWLVQELALHVMHVPKVKILK